jgi:hypothetical protein
LRRTALKPWLGGALAVVLLVAQWFAFAHEYDAAAHSNGGACAICVTAASFGAANVAAAVHFEPAVAASFIVVAAGIVFLTVVPARRYARGPPSVSFTL